MKHILKRAYRKLRNAPFARDERGNIMVLTAFMTPALLMAGATAVDLGEMYRAKVNFQVAVDAATLTFAKEYAAAKPSSSGRPLTNDQKVAQATPIAQEVFRANLGNISTSKGNIVFDVGDGDCNTSGATGTAFLDHEVYFDWLNKASSVNDKNVKYADGTRHVHPDNHVHLTAKSTVRCNNSDFEIALVLDNSGSMRSNGKLTTLRGAASNLVNSMFSSMASRIDDGPLAFSIVPFAGSVNVGSHNATASWMDVNGVSPVHHENLNWDEDPNVTKVGNKWVSNTGETMTRFKLYENLTNVSWKGCVEVRPDPYQTTDDEPTESTPKTMIVPAFAPDTPDDWSGRYDKKQVTTEGKATCEKFESRWFRSKSKWKKRTARYCKLWTDGRTSTRHPQDYAYKPERDDRIEYRNGKYIGPDVSGGTSWVDDNRIDEETYQNNYLPDDHNFPDSLGHSHAKEYTGTGDDQYKRQKWTWKYFKDSSGDSPKAYDVNNGSSRLPTVLGSEGGPNFSCSSAAITDLTTDQDVVIDGINAMKATGSTNIQQGVAWGWRTLSPQAPFERGKPYGTSGNRKIMIVMSDGNNTYYPINQWYRGYSGRNKSYYGAWGHSVNGRIFDGFDAISNPDHTYSTFRQAMDYHLAETCTNAKAAGITIYSIAFDVPNGSSVQRMLEACASTDLGGSALYFPANNNAALVKAFDDILQSLSELRIAQ